MSPPPPGETPLHDTPPREAPHHAVSVGGPTVRDARVDDGPRLARVLGRSDPAAAERVTRLIPDPDEVGRALLVAELRGEVVGYASVVWLHPLRAAGPAAHVEELVVATGDDDLATDRAHVPGDEEVARALRSAVRELAATIGAVDIAGPGWAAPRTLPSVIELPEGRTALAVPALRELRPHLPADDEAVVARIDRIQRAEGYRLFAVTEPGDGPAVAVAGFRRISNLAWGDVLYIDDLSTCAAARGRGAASALLAAVDDEARQLGLDAVHLDSGHGSDRAVAHRVYLRHGYRISSHHFSRQLRRDGGR